MAKLKSGLALAFCALALTCAVIHMTAEENFVKEASPSEDASMMQSMAEKRKMNAWRQFYAAKKLLPKIKKASLSAYKQVTGACRSLKTHAYQSCGKFYCVKRAQCNNPCKARFGQPAREIIPLIGNKFYKVKRVSLREKAAKEKNKKELTAKQVQIKRIKKHAQHLAKKEAEEQERRNKADVVAKTAEKVRKGKLVIAERKARQKKDKAEKGFHNAVVIKCTKRSDDAYLKCEKDKLAEQKVKASEKKYKYKKEKAEKKKKKHMAWLKKMMEKKAKAAAQTYSSTQGKMVKGLQAYASAQKLRTFAKQAGGNAAAVYQSGTLQREQSYASSVVPPPASQHHAAGYGGAMSFSDVFTEAVPTSVAGAKMGEIEAEKALSHPYTSGSPGASKARAALKASAAAFRNLAVQEDRLKYATIKFDQDRSAAHVEQIQMDWHKKELSKCNAQLKSLNTYIETHRAILHTYSCKKTTKYHFNVCYSRAQYRSKLRHTRAIKKSMVKMIGLKSTLKSTKRALSKVQAAEAKAVARVKRAQANSKKANAAALKATAVANEKKQKHTAKVLKLTAKKKAAAIAAQQQKALAYARQLAGGAGAQPAAYGGSKEEEFTQAVVNAGKKHSAKWACRHGHNAAWAKCTGALDQAYKLCAGMFRNSARI